MTTAPIVRAFDRIRAVREKDADATERALLGVLAPVAASAWPEVAWRAGVLTATGYPVELAWASRDVALRWTCEVAGPETPEADRLGLANKAAGSTMDVDPWAAGQEGHSLRWGAWLGSRQLGGARRAKIYLELPGGRLPPGPWCAAAAGLRKAGEVIWRMAGLNDDGTVELYARMPDLTWEGLAAAGSLAGDGKRLVATVRELTGSRVVPRPPGISLVLGPSGEPLAMTSFAIAKTIWPSDAAVCAAVRRSLDEVDPAPGSPELYEALATGPDDGRWRHGMVGVGVDRAGGAWVQAGLRPT